MGVVALRKTFCFKQVKKKQLTEFPASRTTDIDKLLLYTVSQKHVTVVSGKTLANVNQFSKFFHCWT